MYFEYDQCNLVIIQSLYNFYANYTYAITCQAIYQAVEEIMKHKWGGSGCLQLEILRSEFQSSKNIKWSKSGTHDV